jgi:outer membrane receptor protein involved in Fe transport
MFKKILFLLLTFAIPMFVFSQTTGKIMGMISDKETGEPLPGVNVVVEGTYLGASTDVDGYYVIMNVPVGEYNISSTYVGYQEVIVQGMRVSVGLTTEINFELETTTLVTEAIVILAERERIRKDETNTNIITTSDDIKNMTVRGIQEIAALTAGVVKQDNSNTMNIRGGRGGESSVYVDGVLVNDPYNKEVRIYLPNEAIEEMSVQTGGFNAEYGESMSGIIITTTKSGSQKYSGSVQAITDEFLSSTDKGLGTYSYGYNEYSTSLSGPIIPGMKHTFFFSGARRWRQDNTPSWGWAENENKPEGFKGGVIPGNISSDWAFTAKLKFYLSKKMNVKGSVVWTDRTISNINPIWLYNTAHAPEWNTEDRSYNVTFTHTLSANTFYNLRANYFHTFRQRYDRYFEDDLLAYGDPTKNPMVSAGSYDYGQQYNARIEPDFFAPGCQFNDYFKNETDYYGIDFDLTHQQGKHHTIKTGFGYKYHTLREYRVIEPVKFAVEHIDRNSAEYYRGADVRFYGYDINGNEVDDGDYFNVVRNSAGIPISGFNKQAPYNPIIMNFYLQDKIELEDLIINLGLRYDRIDPNAWQFKDMAAELDDDGNIVPGTGMFHGDRTFNKEDIEDSEVHQFLSPRFGVSFPVTERTIFHAQYGKFYQSPQLSSLYLSPFYIDTWVATGGYFTSIDNPNLKPPKTTSYEVGFKQLLGDYASLRLTAFYKETEDLVQLLPIQTDVTNVAFFENGDFGVIKGLDILFNLRRYKNLAVNFNYELQFATGTGSADASNFDICWQRAGGGNYPSVIMPLGFEQRHTGSLNVDYRFGVDEKSVLKNTGINLLLAFNSGQPYTRMLTYNTNPFTGRYDNDGISEQPISAINSETTPMNTRFDLKLDRRFDISAAGFKSSITLYFWVYNLFNSENVMAAWQTTGLPGDTGFLSTTAGKEEWAGYSEQGRQNFKMREMDYNNYGIPRQMRLGVKLEF